MMPPSALIRALAAPTFVRRFAAALVFLVFAGFAAAQDAPLRVAAYDAPPYGNLEPDGSVDGVSVDLWRRVAESLGREYHLVPVTQMEAILQGLERKDYDVAIGAIAITPARLARVDFSYPTHRSGAAVAVREDTAPMAALASYGITASQEWAPDRGGLLRPPAIVILARAAEPPRRRTAQGR
jgi:ABC-type amino acid transport substrate-binding protein